MANNPLNFVPDKVLEAFLVFFGFVAMLTPMALWISWSEFTFFLVLGVGATAIGAFILLSWQFNLRHDAESPD